MEHQKFDWWGEVDKNWSDLFNLINQFHPKLNRSHDMEITAVAAEAFRLKTVEEIKHAGNPLITAQMAKNLRLEKELWNVFNETWWGMPESASVRSVAGFNVLCDLCSEFGDCFGDVEESA